MRCCRPGPACAPMTRSRPTRRAASTRRILTPAELIFCKGAYEAAQGADALLIATEWKEFRSPDYDRLKTLLREPLIFDGRNLYDPGLMERMGLQYFAVGRGRVLPAPARLGQSQSGGLIVMLVPVILSGGAGTRLWPLSRELYPKQLLPLAEPPHDAARNRAPARRPGGGPAHGGVQRCASVPRSRAIARDRLHAARDRARTQGAQHGTGDRSGRARRAGRG